MASTQRAVIQLQVIGSRESIAALNATSGSVRGLTAATAEQGRASKTAAERTWIHNQALFTLRRYAYTATLALTAMIGVTLKWGYDFNTTMATARVALSPVITDQRTLNAELAQLFNIAKYSPFQFKDLTVAFRQMYLAMQPLGISATTVNQTVQALVDALSAAGKTTPGALNRVAVALQHMAFMGHLTGQVVLQLARDGLPIYAALTTQLGLTADQLHHVGNLGVPALDALNAINKYIETTPGFMNAAARQAKTLHGQLTTLKDNIAQFTGALELGTFRKGPSFINRINETFNKISKVSTKQGGRIGFFQGLDIAAKTFPQLKLLESVLRVIFLYIDALYKIIRNAWIPALTDTAKILGAVLFPILIAVGYALQFLGKHGLLLRLIFTYLLVVWGASKTVLMALWVWERLNAAGIALWNSVLVIQRARIIALRGVYIAWLLLTKRMYFAQLLENFGMVRATKAIRTMSNTYSILTKGIPSQNAGVYRALTKFEVFLLRVRKAFMALKLAAMEYAGAVWALVPAQVAALLTNPFFWVALAVIAFGLLYWKVKAFRDAINDIVTWLWRHPLVAMFIPAVGQLVIMARLFKHIYEWAKKLYDLFSHPLRTFGKKGLGGTAESWATSVLHGLQLAGLQGGGTVQSAGAFMVGERGPEIALLPRGSSVIPTQPGTKTAGMSMPIFPSELLSTIYVQLDSKTIAKAVAKQRLDVAARA